MIYYWILKYYLYNLYSKRGRQLGFAEGGSFALIMFIPIITFMFGFGIWDVRVAKILGILITVIDFIITWDDEKVETIFISIENDKEKLYKKMLIVKIFVFAMLAIPVLFLIWWLFRRF